MYAGVCFGFDFPCFCVRRAITVAAAANVQFALEDVKALFEKESGITIKAIVGSSGKLAAQIENGAPFDIFLSADMDYPQAIYKKGFTSQEPKVYACGVLVLWTLKDIDISKGIEVIASDQVKKIAIANPKTAPYGRESINAIEYYGLYPAANPKLVYGESISQANQFVICGAADICFTAKSVVMSDQMKGKGKWIEIDSRAYHSLAQGAVILHYGQKHHSQAANKFYDFLFSEKAKEIFKKYGYVLP